MSYDSYHDAKTAQAMLAHSLMDSDWDVHGYHEDKSDIQSDYYQPARWDGYAIRGKFRIVSSAARSGEKITRHVTDQVPCEHCAGTGQDPDLKDWTLARARANPRAYHDAEEAVRRARGDLGVSLMRDVVSPIPFQNHGTPNCSRCSRGVRFVNPRAELIETYPTFATVKDSQAWAWLETTDGVMVKTFRRAKTIAKAKWGRREGAEDACAMFDAMLADIAKLTGCAFKGGARIED